MKNINVEKIVKNDKGAILVYTLLTMMVIAIVCVSFTMLSMNAYKNTAISASKEQSFLYAKSVGQAFAVQLVKDYEASNIIAYLEKNTDRAKTVQGTASIRFNHNMNSEKYGNLTDINITAASVKFYFKITCLNCGRRLEDLDESGKCPYCEKTQKSVDNTYLYVDVGVSYNGATEIVTSVFTYVDKNDFEQNMYDLFSVYNIYSTMPSKMSFNINPSVNEQAGATAPNVYLYNGTDSTGYSDEAIVYYLKTNISANLTSTGNITVSTDNSVSDLRRVGESADNYLTSYGSVVLSRVRASNVISRGSVTLRSNSVVDYDITSRMEVYITGSGKENRSARNIFALGDIVLKNCEVQNVYGAASSNVKLENCTVNGEIVTGGSVTVEGNCTLGSVSAGRTLTVYNKGGNNVFRSRVACGEDMRIYFNNAYYSEFKGEVLVLKSLIANSPNSDSKADVFKTNVYVSDYMLKGVSVDLTNMALKIEGFLSIMSGRNGDDGGKVTDLGALQANKVCIGQNGVYEKISPLFACKTNIDTLIWMQKEAAFYANTETEIDEEKEDSYFIGGSEVENNHLGNCVNCRGSVFKVLYLNKNGGEGGELYMCNATILNTVVFDKGIFYDVTFGNGSNDVRVVADDFAIFGSGVTLTSGVKVSETIGAGSSQGSGSIIDSGFVSMQKGSTLDSGALIQTEGDCYLNGLVKGKIVVGDSNKNHASKLRIKSHCKLQNIENDQHIYVNGSLYVDNVLKSENDDRLLIKDGVGPTIYMDGKENVYGVELTGPVYNLYCFNSGEITVREPSESIFVKSPFIAGASIISKDYVKIDKNGLPQDIQSQGCKLTASNSILFVAEAPQGSVNVGELMVAGTVVIRKGVSFKCDSMYTGNIIGNADIAATANPQQVRDYVNSNKEKATTVANLTTTSDFQLDYAGSKAITFSNCNINGWFRAANATATITFDHTLVWGKNYHNYPDDKDTPAIDESENKSTGCVVVGNNLVLKNNSAIGGDMSNKQTTTQNLGHVGCKILEITSSRIWGDVSCESIKTFAGGAKIKGNVVMTASATITWADCEVTTGSVLGKNITLTLTKGVLGKDGAMAGTINSYTTDKSFIALSALKCNSDNAYIGNDYNVFLDKTSTIGFKSLSNVNFSATTGTLTLRKASGGTSTPVIKGVLYCAGTLDCLTGVYPCVQKGLYCNNLSANAVDFSNTTINGNVYIVNSTREITLKTNGYNVKATKCVVNLKEVSNATNFEVKGLNVDVSGGSIGKIKSEGKVSIMSSGALSVEGEVSGSIVTCNVNIGSSNGKSISPNNYTNYSSGRTVTFKKYISATLSCYFYKAEVKGTLSTKGGVYASSTNFYSDDYQSNIYHCYYNGSGQTPGGSIRATLNGSAGLSEGTYALYLTSCNVYSNIYVASGTRKSYFSSCNLGETIDTNVSNATKYYYFSSSVELSYTEVKGVKLLETASPSCKTVFEVANGNLTIDSGSYIGYHNGSNKTDPFNGSKRPDKHTGIDGLYVGGTIDNYGWITVNVRRCVKFNNYSTGVVAYQKKENQQWSIWVWYVPPIDDDYDSDTCCGGVFYAGSVSNSGYISMSGNQRYRKQGGWSTSYSAWSTDNKHYEYGSEGTICSHNVDNYHTSNSGSAYNCGNRFTSTSLPSVSAVTISPAFQNKPISGGKSVKFDYVGVGILSNASLGEMEFYNTSLANYATQSLNDLNSLNKTVPTNGLDVADTRGLEAKERMNVSNRRYWKPMAIPLRWYKPTQTTAGETVKLNEQSGNVLQVSERNLASSYDNLRNAVNAYNSIVDSLWPPWEWGDIPGQWNTLKTNVTAFFQNLKFAFMPSTQYIGLSFKNQDDGVYRRLSASNINQVMSDKGNSDILLITRRVIMAKDTIPPDWFIDGLSKINISWPSDWVLPVSWSFNKRPVAAVFFESGIVPLNMFQGTTYREYAYESTEKDASGRWYWGGGQEGVWYGGLSSSLSDVNWVFFTCEDPRNPYTSKAKDLHIILPESVAMNWTKDKNNSVSIIGNGRVFLYVQSNSNIKVVGNGFTNWLSD